MVNIFQEIIIFLTSSFYSNSILGLSGGPHASRPSPCRGFSVPIVRHLWTRIARGRLSRPLPEGRHGEGEGGGRGSKSARPQCHLQAGYVQQVDKSGLGIVHKWFCSFLCPLTLNLIFNIAYDMP